VLVLCIATLALIALCWPLWLDDTPFPRVPFLRGWPTLSTAVSFVLLAALGASVAMVPSGLARPWPARLSVGILVFLVAGDQARLQPWLYQYLLEAFVLAFVPRRLQALLIRTVVAAIYLHSGLSKLDHAFLHELGPVFLRTLLGLFGVSPSGWPPPLLHTAVLSMPVGELGIGILLFVPSGNRLGIIGACVMHVLLLAIVGPLGLGHSATVVGWNLALLAEVPLLFWQRLPGGTMHALSSAGASPTSWLIGAATVLPLGERWGIWDSWPSFALYASHNERIELRVHEGDAAFWPAELRRYLVPTTEPGVWLVDVTNWSRFTRGVPPYPQARTGIGVALGLADLVISPRPFHARVLGRARWWTGEREVMCEGGSDQLRLVTNRFFWNALPARMGNRWGEPFATAPGVSRQGFGPPATRANRRGVAE
jgi:hypothetical protein